ncbi:hypothetical protein L1887_55526 [Cichorium endivia]|nr:hypothetical protein L1887_55526 [Cichorium endivia]
MLGSRGPSRLENRQGEEEQMQEQSQYKLRSRGYRTVRAARDPTSGPLVGLPAVAIDVLRVFACFVCPTAFRILPSAVLSRSDVRDNARTAQLDSRSPNSSTKTRHRSSWRHATLGRGARRSSAH